MANYTVPSRHGKQIPLQTQDRDHLSALDVVWANKYEGEIINPLHAMEMEVEFYRGAPPRWLNFYWAEHQNSPFAKRDVYKKLQDYITKTEAKSWRSIAHVNLFQDPGSGGSTLAMQVLWDLRKKFRCAKLLDSPKETKAIAQQVLRLFRAGGSENQNTVLLLLDNKHLSEDDIFRANLEENLCDEIKANNITATIPVVIILRCLHQINLEERSEDFILRSDLSVEERGEFKRKQSDVIQKHGERHTQLHAFNIMLNNYNPGYVREICKVLNPLTKKGRKQQLLAFLALINSYVPGSELPYDLCLTFIKGEINDHDHFSLEKHMQPFTGFLTIFSGKEEAEVNSEDKHVRIVHPMIAQECLRLLSEAGATRSYTTLNLLKELCKDTAPPRLVRTIKTLLTKRENSKFSKLILDMQKEANKENNKEGEGKKNSMCVAVLKLALKKFSTDPFLPQALARFCYIEMQDYERAIHWAEEAIRRDKKNSFIRDTLGQVHKNRLRNFISKESLALKNKEEYARKILQYGKKAAEAFKAEQEVALEEHAPEMQEHGMTITSTIFNNRGLFGYMQVAQIIFDHIKDLHEDWLMVLTKETPPHRFLSSYHGGKCEKYKSFITCLRDEVEDKFNFFEQYLLYSKPTEHKDEPDYFWPGVYKCYSKFVEQVCNKNKLALQILKENKASTFAGLLSTYTDLELITLQWKEIYLNSPNDVQVIQNYIGANVMLSQSSDRSPALRPLDELQEMLHNLWTKQKDKRSPEFYLLVLLLFWPDAKQSGHNTVDIAECIRYMHSSFETTYKNYLRSRYLVPLFYLKIGHGLQRFVHNLHLDKKSLDEDKIPELRVSGEVQNYKLYFVQGSVRIEVSPVPPASLRRRGNVSFCLGFTIKGPMAYKISYEQ